MTSNGGRDEKFPKSSNVKDEYEGDVNIGVGNGNGSGSQRNDGWQNGKIDGSVKVGGDPAVPHQQLQPQGSLSHWDQFLHVRSIKVMLVENDDSTRHIVTALLRNCNYEVIEAANGLQAWKILEDLSNHIDIVLTEVIMPSFSGFGLLCKIMSHKTRKNIPVIMMSSHDSMGLVFKCLSKGAADFLLKPIRKNELKNLWQHVWRRCHSSSGSGSESATNAQNSVNSKQSDSMVGEDIGSSRDGSDDGSGTQSSWTKQAVELDSPQAGSPCNQTNGHQDSTCGVVIHSEQIPTKKDFQNQEIHEDNVGKDSDVRISLNAHNGIEHLQDFDPTKNMRGDDMYGSRVVNAEYEAVKEPKVILDANAKAIDDSRETVTELSLKRPREVKDVKNGHNVLRHSELSAFTRYNTTINATRNGVTSSGFQLDNNSQSVKKDSTRDAHSDGFLIYQGLNEAQKHHHVHRYKNTEPADIPAEHIDPGLKTLAASAPHCGSSNVLGAVAVGNVENCSLNRSGSGSKHGSNVPNGSSTGVNLEGKDGESGGGLTGKSGGGGSGSGGSGGGGGGSGSEIRKDPHKSAQREAALIKFLEKKKDRCFKKKIRYQNRKQLAEQRPRVRGQFVKQTGRESSSNAAEDG
ncbi:putative response regulator and transcription factor RR-A-type family [Helianthus annuus]|uniref:Putative pseudo-response regulator 7 n=2 Tax=Helianthus annuus TaxID=4232 RepID=A0A251VRJ2_HELAN|nr:two-component response regulator-like APRR7 isoform X2 [Helianthus annuus]XP_021985307.1 two-component response regulator-like APRR7 isoform X2 [Helianthus annuus]XP_035831368.1 two-component response regulator-like APRR7 isoform X2 [Helianthus annuus]XP_035831370.1 two-component response regulator-like APRR7 isoform X2 [Helianthus annuus]XP_035831371.1 two-component response regulator-like APRR7 isoform X2 [Helianthus annuus]XP_035831372.1 two-component response regulator-like APRR7 isofor